MQLRQRVSVEAYIADFQRLDVMVSHISEARLVMLVDGITYPFHGLGDDL